MSATHAIRQLREKRSKQLAQSVGNELKALRLNKAKSDSKLLSSFASAVRDHAKARRAQIARYSKRRSNKIGEMIRKVEGVKKRVLECRRRLRAVRFAGKKEIEGGMKAIGDVGKEVVKEVDGLVGEFWKRVGKFSRCDELVRGLARLFGEG